MKQMKRWFGGLSIGVGLVGVVLSVFCVVMLWRAAFVVSERAMEIADLAIKVKDNADRYVRQADGVLGNMQQKVSTLKECADAVSEDAAQNREVVPLIERLDAELVRELGEARSILTSIQSGSDMLNKAVSQFEALSSPMRIFRKSDEPSKDSDLAALSRSLTEVSNLVQQVIDFVTKMERQGITDEQARKMKLAVTRLGESLDQGHIRLTSLRDSLQEISDGVAAKRDKVPMWTNIAATLCTALLVCFGFTQIHLIGYGWPKLAAPSESPAAQKPSESSRP